MSRHARITPLDVAVCAISQASVTIITRYRAQRKTLPASVVLAPHHALQHSGSRLPWEERPAFYHLICHAPTCPPARLLRRRAISQGISPLALAATAI